MRSNRHAFAVAFATAIALGCGGSSESGGTGPNPDDGAYVSIVTPASGSVSVQSTWPDSISFVIVARNNKGAITPTDSLDGIWIGNQTKFSYPVSEGNHVLKACVQNYLGAWKCATSSFSHKLADPIPVQVVSSARLGPIDYGAIRGFARRGAVMDWADFGSDSVARISPRLRLLPDTGRTEVWFDFKSGANRTHYPSYTSVSRDSLGIVQKFPAVPFRYTIACGLWAGQTMVVDLSSAFAQALDGLSFYYRFTSPGGIVLYNQGGWRQAVVSVSITMKSGASLSAVDSARFASFLNELTNETCVSFQLVQPIATQGGDPSGMISVVISETRFVDIPPFNIGPTGDILGCGMLFDMPEFQERFVVKHDIMHCLGVGHTADGAWFPSLMAANQNQGGLTRNDPRYGQAQPPDVGYLRLMYDVQELRRQTGAQHGIANAFVGYKVVILGLAPEVFR